MAWLKKILIISWFFLIPLLIGFYVFNPVETFTFQQETEGNQSYVWISLDDVNPPGHPKTILRNIFSVPFDLVWYNVYLGGEGISLTYPNQTTKTKVGFYEFTIDDAKINATIGDKVTTMKFDKKYSYGLHFGFDVVFKMPKSPCDECSYEPPRTDVHPRYKVYARPLLADSIAKIFLFFMSWAGLSLLIEQVIGKFKKNERIAQKNNN